MTTNNLAQALMSINVGQHQPKDLTYAIELINRADDAVANPNKYWKGDVAEAKRISLYRRARVLLEPLSTEEIQTPTATPVTPPVNIITALPLTPNLPVTPSAEPIFPYHAIEAQSWIKYMDFQGHISTAENSTGDERIGQLNSAISTLDNLIETMNKYTPGIKEPIIVTHLSKVDVLMKLGHKDNAYALINEDSRPFIDNASFLTGYIRHNEDAMFKRGTIKYIDTDFDEAEKELKAVYVLNPGRDGIGEELAKVYDRLRERTLPVPEDYRGIIHYTMDKWADGKNKYQEGLNNLAATDATEEQNNFRDAEQLFREVADSLSLQFLEREPNEREKTLKARALNFQAAANVQLGNIDLAITNLEESINTPTQLAYQSLAQIYRMG